MTIPPELIYKQFLPLYLLFRTNYHQCHYSRMALTISNVKPPNANTSLRFAIVTTRNQKQQIRWIDSSFFLLQLCIVTSLTIKNHFMISTGCRDFPNYIDRISETLIVCSTFKLSFKSLLLLISPQLEANLQALSANKQHSKPCFVTPLYALLRI